MKKVDERDVIFARMNYGHNSKVYDEYYSRNPQKKECDDNLRKKDLMGGDSANFYHPIVSKLPDACFEFLADIKQFSDKAHSKQRIENDLKATESSNYTPQQYTTLLKGLAKYYNAKDVKIIKLKDEHYYSNKGRPLEEYGEKIEEVYKYGIIFYVEMSENIIGNAPFVTESIATSKGYIDSAIIGMVISYFLRSLGYLARNNMDGNYLFPLVNIAQESGLGEIGLNGMLITKEYGPRIRLGMVSTNLELIEDKKKEFNIKKFCSQCKRCIKYCPSKALGKQEDNTFFSDVKCLSTWQKLGSDCGICLSTCPFSHNLPKGLVDNLSDPEQRQKLKNYCDEKYPNRINNSEIPDWISI